MANGKPGDHPLTDILSYGASDYGESVDSLIKDIAAQPAFGDVREEVSTVLWDYWPKWLNAVEGGREIAFDKLLAIKARMTK